MATTASERVERTEVPTRARAAIFAAAGLFVHAAFQLALALGAPFARARTVARRPPAGRVAGRQRCGGLRL